jgi:omega-hydroxypalmitate O-feruloyl transferase
VNIVPVPWNMFGFVDLCLFLPPSNLNPLMKGGVRIFVSLPKASMAKFKEEMEFLKVMKVDEDI